MPGNDNMKYIDAHCHISARPTPNVDGRIFNATCESEWMDIINQTAHDTTAYGAIGIHPWFAATVAPGWDIRMAEIIATNPQLMVGEIGLDKNRGNISAQADVFAKQLNIARQYRRAAHIHGVGAWDIMRDALSDMTAPVVFHAFGGSVETMRQMSARCDAYFSFSHAVTNPRRRHMRECAIAADANRILVETDADAHRDASVEISDVVAEIAKLRGVDNTKMADIIYNNTIRIIKNG